VYRERLFQERLKTDAEKPVLAVDLQDLRDHNEDLGRQLERAPMQMLPLLEEAAATVMRDLGAMGSEGEKQLRDVQVTLHSSTLFGPTSLRELTAESVTRLVMIPGIVTHAQCPLHKAAYLMLQCQKCNQMTKVPCNNGLDSAHVPRNCSLGDGACGLDPFVVLPAESRFVDTQKLKLQERPEDVPTGELPRHCILIADRALVDRVVPGTRVTVLGIHSLMSSGPKGNVAGLGQPYIRVVGLQEDFSGLARGAPVFSQEEVAAFRKFAAQPDVQDRIFGMVAPQIFGSEDIKKAVACLLFGGSRKRLPDGVTLRGDINVLLLGDPSTAKSQFLKFVERTAPIAVYTSGKGSSAAGLTATVVRDAGTREFYLEGGAMVLADGGVVCIDEFDKMRDEDRVAIHEAMEQQTISIAKAGITTVLNARAAVLAAANPPSGKYDNLKSAQENIDLQSTILSRFDLIFIVKDERNRDRDRQIAAHVVKVHANAGAVDDKTEEQLEQERFLKRYIQYAKSRVHTRLSPEAARVLGARYVKYRADVAKAQASGRGSVGSVPITVRQLESLIRTSESLARMTLQETATEAHVTTALALFDVATMDAVKSGLTEGITFTREQIAEVDRVTKQIQRRIQVGGRVSERRLIGELTGLGIREDLVRRAIVMMVNQTRELEYIQERRQLRRVA